METTQSHSNPLRAMREEAGLSTRQAAVAVGKALNKSRTHASIIKIEREGTNMDNVVDALAEVYKKEPEEVRKAARELRENFLLTVGRK